jgi:hypothetical protein
MQNSAVRAAVGACLVAASFATPTPVEKVAITPAAVVRQASSASGTPITNQNQLDAAFGSFSADFKSIEAAISVGEAIFTNIVPAPGPTAFAQISDEIQKIIAANPGDIFKSGADHFEA